MSGKPYKMMLSAVAIVLLVGASFLQRELTHEREELGLTRYEELKGAPPVLAMTTVALGGFRGLISNILWIRANDLQEDGKYFEMVQLADWITKLEPHFTQVWLVQGWNMAYNISVKFKDAEDRWRWVQRGIELLRDDGLRFNPDDVLIHRELAWFFQHKMGANLDDAHMLYKQRWANEMSRVLGTNSVQWDVLLNPKTDAEKARVFALTNKYKLDPRFMKQVDEQYGPLEWRLPEAHAIYWAAQGLEAAKRNERKINPDDLITLRRVIYQSMQLSFQRGRLIANKTDKVFMFGPNLEIIPKVSAAYEQAMVDDPKNRDHIETAHRNLVKDIVYFLYTYNRQADAARWYKYLGEKYPNKPLLEMQTNSLPRNLSLEDYALARIQDETGDTSKDKTQALIEGLEGRAFLDLAIGNEDHYLGMEGLARQVYNRYSTKIAGDAEKRVALPPMEKIRGDVLNRMLDNELSPELSAQLRTILKLPAPAPKPEPAATTNTPPATTEAATRPE